MRRLSVLLTALLAIALLFNVTSMSACGGTSRDVFKGSGSSGGSGGSGGSSGVIGFGDDGGGSSGGGDGGAVCPPGLQCNVQCSGGTTTIKGTVYDPAARNPLYGVAVYVPESALQPLPKGVPTGSDACNCAALFKSGAVVSTSTGVDGTFTLQNAPVGSAVPLVLQVGKWRKEVTIDVAACAPNQQPDKSLRMPNSTVGHPNDSMPDIAVSTGSADTLECLMTRIGLPPTEYVAGTGTTGHVHVYSGGNPNGGVGGSPEVPAMAGAPESDTNLWPDQQHLMPYDIVLLSCESDETYNANPKALEDYLNAGGRVFASHFHYAWFAGPITTGQGYAAPADWGTNLATWAGDQVDNAGPIGGTIIQTLNGSTKPFPKGVILDQWLALVGALGKNIPVATDLSIYSPRYNAGVTATNVHSQPWIQGDPAAGGPKAATEYFSFDTPVNAPNAPDGGPPSYCGRAVFSDLHVGSDPSTNDMSPPPDGCATGPLSPQEKALEFMLFDLSSCVLPDTVTPPDAGVILQ